MPVLSIMVAMGCDSGVPYGPADGADPYVQLQLSARTTGAVNGAWELWIGVPRSDAVEALALKDPRLRIATVGREDFLILGSSSAMDETWSTRMDGIPYRGLLLVAEPSAYQPVSLNGTGIGAVWYELHASGEDEDQYCSPGEETAGGINVDASTTSAPHQGGGMLCY